MQDHEAEIQALFESLPPYIGDKKLVHSTGPVPCDIMLVGEAPGKNENISGSCFIGDAGETLDTYLYKAGWPRDYAYVTNLSKYWPGRDSDGDMDPSLDAICRDWPVLMREIELVQPKVIVALGAVSTEQLISGTDGAGLNMEALNGRPIRVRLREANWEGWVVPVYHPAAGLHDPSFAALGYLGLKAAVDFLKGGCVGAPEDNIKRNYSVLTDEDYATAEYELESSFQFCHDLQRPMGTDTEGYEEDPGCLTASPAPGIGYLIPATSVRVLALFDSLRKKYEVKLALHNCLHDLGVLREMGIQLFYGEYEDTMVRLYNLACESPKGQGLKPAGFKYAGVKMTSYEDTIGPYDDKVVSDYLTEAKGLFESGEVVVEPKSKRAHTPARRIQSLLTKAEEGDDERLLRDRWKKFGTDKKSIGPEVKVVTESVLGPVRKLTFEDAPIDVWTPYACLDADVTGRLYPILWEKGRQMGIERCYEIDMKVIPILERMTQVGMWVDKKMLGMLQLEMEAEKARLEKEIHSIATKAGMPESFNPGSDDQMAVLLYDRMGLHAKKKTGKKQRGKVDDKALTSVKCNEDPNDKHRYWCRGHHPDVHKLIELLLTFREVETILTSHVQPLWNFIGSDGRVHPNWRHTVVVSGRLACSAPNLLAFPKHSKWGKRLRACFRARPGYVYASFDLSQIEMRVMASEAEDWGLIDLFLTGGDIHKMTAMGVLKATEESAKDDKIRTAAKTVNFGIAYGFTPKGLKDSLFTKGVVKTEEECAALIAAWFEMCAGVKEYFRQAVAETRKYGYVRDMWGRIRHLPSVWSTIDRVRSEAERQACNLKIQGGAQGVEKRGMAEWWFGAYQEFKARGIDIEPMLQIHDDMMFEVEEGRVDEIKEETREAFQASSQDYFSVPILCDAKYGDNWGEMEKD